MSDSVEEGEIVAPNTNSPPRIIIPGFLDLLLPHYINMLNTYSQRAFVPPATYTFMQESQYNYTRFACKIKLEGWVPEVVELTSEYVQNKILAKKLVAKKCVEYLRKQNGINHSLLKLDCVSILQQYCLANNYQLPKYEIDAHGVSGPFLGKVSLQIAGSDLEFVAPYTSQRKNEAKVLAAELAFHSMIELME